MNFNKLSLGLFLLFIFLIVGTLINRSIWDQTFYNSKVEGVITGSKFDFFGRGTSRYQLSDGTSFIFAEKVLMTGDSVFKEKNTFYLKVHKMDSKGNYQFHELKYYYNAAQD